MNVYCQGSFEGWNDANFPLTNNPAQNVTNNGIVTTMPYAGTYAWAASPGAMANYKFVYNNGGDVYENVLVHPDPASGNRFFQNEPQTLPLVSFGDVPFSATVTNNVTFIVDMSVEAAVGAFSVANGNTVEIHGDYNNWGGGTMMSNNPADPDTNHYYVTLQYIQGQGSPAYFKYVIQPGTTWESINNRSLIMGPTGNYTNGPVYFNNNGSNYLKQVVTVTNEMVTFTVDMTPAVNGTYNSGGPFILGFDNVYLNGINGGNDNSYWKWSVTSPPPAYQMTEVPNDGVSPIYTITVPVNQGQPLYLQYKYGIDGQDNEANVNNNHNRHIRSEPNWTMPTDTFASQGSGNQQEPQLGDFTVDKSGSTVVLSWLGGVGITLQTTTSLNPPIVWTPLPLTDGTNLTVTQGPGALAPAGPVGMATTNYPSGSGNLFYQVTGP